MKLKDVPNWPALLLLALSALLAGCGRGSLPLQPQSVAPPRIPTLSNAARVSKVPTPSMCSPGCSRGLTTERESWLSTPIDYALPAWPAKPSTIPFGGKR